MRHVTVVALRERERESYNLIAKKINVKLNEVDYVKTN